MVATVLEGDVTITILLSRTHQRIIAGKNEISNPAPLTFHDRIVNLAEGNSTTEVIRHHRWIKNYTENIEQQRVVFVDQDEVRMQIHVVNEELPDELVNLLMRYFFQQVPFHLI